MWFLHPLIRSPFQGWLPRCRGSRSFIRSLTKICCERKRLSNHLIVESEWLVHYYPIFRHKAMRRIFCQMINELSALLTSKHYTIEHYGGTALIRPKDLARRKQNFKVIVGWYCSLSPFKHTLPCQLAHRGWTAMTSYESYSRHTATSLTGSNIKWRATTIWLSRIRNKSGGKISWTHWCFFQVLARNSIPMSSARALGKRYPFEISSQRLRSL